jgi:hypothetical protein
MCLNVMPDLFKFEYSTIRYKVILAKFVTLNGWLSQSSKVLDEVKLKLKLSTSPKNMCGGWS